MAATRVNEFTPLLVTDDAFRPPIRRRSVWQYVLAGALSLGVLSLFQQQDAPSLNVADVAVSLDETPDADDAAFLSSMETFKDPSVDPCVDFYEYACGGWLKSHEIPSDRPSIDSSFYVVSESNKDTIQRIFDQNPPQIGQLHQSCLNNQEVDADAVAFVAQLIDNVHQVDSTLALLEYAGELDQSLGISSFFSLFVGADPEDPSTNVLQLAQGGLTLPSREYYLEETKVDAYAALYVDYVTKLFAVGNLDKHNVSEYAEAVLETETAFAKISLPNAALRNPWTTNTAYPFAEIAQRYPFLMAYLNGIYKQEPFPMLHAIIATPDFFKAQNELLSDESLLPQLKNYLSFHLIDSFGAILGEYFRRASHEFHGTIQGAGTLLPRDQFCVRLTTAFLGDELGEYYMKEVFGPDAKAAAQALVAEIEESLKALLLTESWLDKVTYDAAVDKLNKVRNYIGGPDKVQPLPFELQSDAFFNNVKSLMQLAAAGTIQAVNKPVDPHAWDMFPSTVNAYYDPSANKMVFPAAILQPPFYSADHFPAAANFARIGMVMGHELSHGFDDQGRNYDSNGALRSWWTPSVSAEFAEKAQCLAAQYSTFPVVSIEDGHVVGTVNGNLTLGENIADNGGIRLAYEAYHLWKSTFAPPPIEPPASPPAVVPEQSPEPAQTEPSPTTEATPVPESLPPTEKETPQPNPNEDIPVVTPAPVVPIPDEPVPQPSETGPGEQIPVVTLPPPVLPVPEAETPEPAQTEPGGVIPVATPTSPPPVIPEPQPADVGPGEVIPEETSPAPATPAPEPAPTDSEPVTQVPVVPNPPAPSEPAPKQKTPAPFPEDTITPVTPPPVPEEPTAVPASNVPAPIPVDVTPGATPIPAVTEGAPDKHKHKKEKEEPETEHPVKKQKHHSDDEAGKDKKSDKSESKPEEGDEDSSRSGHKHSSDKKTNKEEEEEKSRDKKHERKDEDKKKSSERDHVGKRDKEEQDDHHQKSHHHDDDSKLEDEEDTKKHKTDEKDSDEHKSASHRDQDKRHREDSDYDKSERKNRHRHVGDGDEGDHRRYEHERKHERREHHHRRDEEENDEGESDGYKRKHHDYREYNDREEEEDDERQGKRNYHWDEDDGDSDRHGRRNHESKEERREERKEKHRERREERNEEHRERREERKEEQRERREERQQRREERKERKKEEEEYEKSKHHHHRDEDYDDDSRRRHGHKELTDTWEDCDECGREEYRHHHRDEDYYEDRHHAHKEHADRWEDCDGCGRERHRRHHKHDEEWDEESERGCGEEDDDCVSTRHKWALSERTYPFSGGDARIHSIVQKLARAIVQPNDPVADDRLFFTAFAQNWCEKRTPGYAELLRMIDPHSPGKWRVNGPLMNYDKFAEVFSCPVGTPMNPEKKCVIW